MVAPWVYTLAKLSQNATTDPVEAETVFQTNALLRYDETKLCLKRLKAERMLQSK